MMPSVRERKTNIHNFTNFYPYLCRLQNTIPIADTRVNTTNNSLDLNGDRIKQEDWKLILEAISNDRCLQFIAIRSKQSKNKVSKKFNTDKNTKKLIFPVSKCSRIIPRLKITEALSTCLINSTVLTSLTLEKLLLDSDSLDSLIKGLEVSQSLQKLSLVHAQIGDDGCSSLCLALRHRLNLVWLTLTGCGLTVKGVSLLCNFLKFQKLNRYGESWKQSLRCRPVNTSMMPGLRRLTLNHNPIGDDGIKVFVENLADDLWFKALDLQNCDISTLGAEALLNLVQENKYLSIVDIRNNKNVPNSVIAVIIEQLAENNINTVPEFQWLTEDKPEVKDNAVVSRSTSNLSTTSHATRAGSRPSTVPLPNKHPHLINAKCSTTKRGISNEVLSTRSNNDKDIFNELYSVKEQLKEVSFQLQEEIRRRIRLEQELERYKQILEVSESLKTTDGLSLQAVLLQFCNAYFTKNSSQMLKSEIEEKEDYIKENIIIVKNRDPKTDIDSSLRKCDSPAIVSSNWSGRTHEPSRAQILFDTLISN